MRTCSTAARSGEALSAKAELGFYRANKVGGAFNRPSCFFDVYCLTAIVCKRSKVLNLVEVATKLGWEVIGQNNVLTKLRNKAIVRFHWRTQFFNAKSEQGRMGGVEHRIIGAAACTVRISSLK